MHTFRQNAIRTHPPNALSLGYDDIVTILVVSVYVYFVVAVSGDRVLN